MASFLEDFYLQVARELADPTFSRRLTNPDKLKDFYAAEIRIWERLLRASGQESTIGRTETEITLVDGQEFYTLPGNFRNFIRFERRQSATKDIYTVTGASYTDATKTVTLTDGFTGYILRSGDTFNITTPSTHVGSHAISAMGNSPNQYNDMILTTAIGSDGAAVGGTIQRSVPDSDLVERRYGSIDEYAPGPGVVILSEERGFLVRPKPVLDASETWTLVYQKGPVRLHYATAAKVHASGLVLGTPSTDAGEVIATDDYLNGSMIRVYSATVGALQTREITDHDAARSVVVFRLPFAPTPTGTVLYEVRPALPERYDQLYGMDVAMRNSGRRRNRRWQDLAVERNALWQACLDYYLNNVRDRAPQRAHRINDWDEDPWDYMQ